MDERERRNERGETPLQQADRNLMELLQELRVVQTGVQILFAFLLSLAFTPRFPELDDTQRNIYLIVLGCTVVSTAALIGPVALHRALFRRGAKRRIVNASHRLASVGLAFLALSLTGAVELIFDVVLGRGAGVAAAVCGLLLFATLWLLAPWGMGRRIDRDE
ncbi:DUF6328 family protein [Allostreptomyces psammosilenae]|uniref:Sodium:proton antiporter n=1 Tax=Allostreptomyces psammosilenae TaxID=1892865 RepID=A0A852ZYL7_9ACTN|nr:DUF6328 family protein [Allostreptomyces psammosilenae]NYI03188.1 hypothetical protein [Allostreptomyces psammosilenae]